MTTLGQQIITRLDALEAQVIEMQLKGPTGTSPTELDEMRNQFRKDMTALREEMARGIPTDVPHAPRRQMFNSKDCLPEILSTDFKSKWRAWSYKARDWLSQEDETLNRKLESVESMTAELTPEFIESLGITAAGDAAIRRFLVHRLDGDPAEVVRNSASKPGIEQYRCLAQLCDPAAGGRLWSDAQRLYYPTPAS